VEDEPGAGEMDEKDPRTAWRVSFAERFRPIRDAIGDQDVADHFSRHGLPLVDVEYA
jgi:hypothetical protein